MSTSQRRDTVVALLVLLTLDQREPIDALGGEGRPGGSLLGRLLATRHRRLTSPNASRCRFASGRAAMSDQRFLGTTSTEGVELLPSGIQWRGSDGG